MLQSGLRKILCLNGRKHGLISSYQNFSTLNLFDFQPSVTETRLLDSVISKKEDNIDGIQFHPALRIEKFQDARGLALRVLDNVPAGETLMTVPSTVWNPLSASYAVTTCARDAPNWFAFVQSIAQSMVGGSPEVAERRARPLVESICMAVHLMAHRYATHDNEDTPKGRKKQDTNTTTRHVTPLTITPLVSSYAQFLNVHSSKQVPHPLLMNEKSWIDEPLRNSRVHRDILLRRRMYRRIASQLFPSLEDSSLRPDRVFLGQSDLLNGMTNSNMMNSSQNVEKGFVPAPLPIWIRDIHSDGTYGTLRSWSSESQVEDFLWAIGEILSRGLSSTQSNASMPLSFVPILDFINHGDTSIPIQQEITLENTNESISPINSEHSFDNNTKSFVLKSSRNLNLGEEICISYGNSRDTTSFLALYGFYGDYTNWNNELTLDLAIDTPENSFEFLDSLQHRTALEKMWNERSTMHSSHPSSSPLAFPFPLNSLNITSNSLSLRLPLHLFLLPSTLNPSLSSDIDKEIHENFELKQEMQHFIDGITWLVKLCSALEILISSEELPTEEPDVTPYMTSKDYHISQAYIQRVLRVRFFNLERLRAFDFPVETLMTSSDEEIEKAFLLHLQTLARQLVDKSSKLDGKSYWLACCARFQSEELEALMRIRDMIKTSKIETQMAEAAAEAAAQEHAAGDEDFFPK